MLNTCMRPCLFALTLGLFLLATLRSPCADPVYVRFNTTLGNIDVELRPDLSPLTVANFLSYVNNPTIHQNYNNSFIHRSVPGFVFQGGGYDAVTTVTGTTVANGYYTITTTAPVVGEHVLSNTRGTIAMALSTGPDSATDEWFFNEGDNSLTLDGTLDGGPFTAFGAVANSASLAVMDLISNVPVPTTPGMPSEPLFNPPFDELPLLNYVAGAQINLQNQVITVNSITVLTQTYSAWQSGYSTTGPTTTPLNDSVPNLLKYLCDIDPTKPMSSTDRAMLPTIGQATVSGTLNATLTYRQYALKTGTTVHVQTSTDLQSWTPLTNPTIVQTGNDSTTVEGDPIMQVQVPLAGSKLFIRLNVTQP